MNDNEIITLLKQQYPDVQFELIGSGCNLTIQAIGALFENQSLIARQRLLNTALMPLIKSGVIHAVQYRIYTPDEWREYQEKLNG